MKTIVFDSGPIISLALNDLLWILPDLKKYYNGNFVIPDSVKAEVVDNPLRTRKFAFEAIRVEGMITQNVLEISRDDNVKSQSQDLLTLANSSFEAHGAPMQLVHTAEMEAIVLARELHADAVVIDERTSRMLIEAPDNLKNLLEKRLQTKIKVNTSNLERFRSLLSSVKVIRSAELVSIAYSLGLLDKYLPRNGEVPIGKKKDLIESVLWALKLNGCAISKKNIDQLVKWLLK